MYLNQLLLVAHNFFITIILLYITRIVSFYSFSLNVTSGDISLEKFRNLS